VPEHPTKGRAWRGLGALGVAGAAVSAGDAGHDLVDVLTAPGRGPGNDPEAIAAAYPSRYRLSWLPRHEAALLGAIRGDTVGYALSTTVSGSFDQTLEATRQALADQGFGVLTEIDLSATLKAKMDADIAPQVILGACRPPLAYAAVQAEPSIGLLLPCNVVVRSLDADRTQVEAMDPAVMVELTGNQGLAEVAADARARLTAALAALAS
jgi:uncharacterized protein (DUF302 family)